MFCKESRVLTMHILTGTVKSVFGFKHYQHYTPSAMSSSHLVCDGRYRPSEKTLVEGVYINADTSLRVKTFNM